MYSNISNIQMYISNYITNILKYNFDKHLNSHAIVWEDLKFNTMSVTHEPINIMKYH